MDYAGPPVLDVECAPRVCALLGCALVHPSQCSACERVFCGLCCAARGTNLCPGRCREAAAEMVPLPVLGRALLALRPCLEVRSTAGGPRLMWPADDGPPPAPSEAALARAAADVGLSGGWSCPVADCALVDPRQCVECGQVICGPCAVRTVSLEDAFGRCPYCRGEATLAAVPFWQRLLAASRVACLDCPVGESGESPLGDTGTHAHFHPVLLGEGNLDDDDENVLVLSYVLADARAAAQPRRRRARASSPEDARPPRRRRRGR